MARSAQKLTVHVQTHRLAQTNYFRASGRLGKAALRLPPTFRPLMPLSPTTSAKAYWIDVLTQVIAEIQALP